MGYTHYWENSRTLTEEEATGIHRDIRAILATTSVPLAGWDGDGTPSVPPFLTEDRSENLVSLNGVGDESCETFAFPGGMGFNFCKTRARGYDIVVTAILIAAYDRAPGAMGYSSDGGDDDWEPGRKLAEKATGRKLQHVFS